MTRSRRSEQHLQAAAAAAGEAGEADKVPCSVDSVPRGDGRSER